MHTRRSALRRPPARRTPPRRLVGLAGVALVLAPLAACTDNTTSTTAAPSGSVKAGGDGKVAVTSTATECTLAAREAPAGAVVFSVSNKGTDVTEFYLLAEDGLRIIGEVENIGPGLTRDLVVTAPAGRYVTACKPGMVGDGIRGDFVVTAGTTGTTAIGGDVAPLIETGTAQYAAYVKDQTEQLLAATKDIAAACTAGDTAKMKAMYASTRSHWERVEPVAESFGDLDPRLDLREADLEEGQEWTGWHALEKDLWPPADDPSYVPLTTEQRGKVCDQLVADTQDLYDRTRTLTYTADKLGNGAKELLDEVATGKVTGEEETWSHTDLWDFQANVDGARIAFEDLKPALEVKDPALAATLTTRFVELQAQLDQYRRGDGFALYTELTPAQVKELSDVVNALSEPLSQLTAAVVR